MKAGWTFLHTNPSHGPYVVYDLRHGRSPVCQDGAASTLDVELVDEVLPRIEMTWNTSL